MEFQVFARINTIQTVGNQFSGTTMQLSSQFNTRGTCANDSNPQLVPSLWLAMCMCTNTGIDQPPMKCPRVSHCFELKRILSDAWSTKIVTLTANRDDQRVVTETARWRHLNAIFIDVWPNLDFTALAIDARHFPNSIAKPMPVSLRSIRHFMETYIHAPGRYFM